MQKNAGSCCIIDKKESAFYVIRSRIRTKKKRRIKGEETPGRAKEKTDGRDGAYSLGIRNDPVGFWSSDAGKTYKRGKNGSGRTDT